MKPIIDLHLHLDGSLPISTVETLMRRYPNRVPENIRYWLDIPEEELHEKLLVELMAPADCESLSEYLTRFDLPCRLMQGPEAMKIATLGLLTKLRDDGIKYVEIRFAPQLHSIKYQNFKNVRLQYEKVILNAMIEATHLVPEIKVGFILCCMRNLPDKMLLGYDPNENTIALMDEFYKKGVVAMDLAGAEARDETEQFCKLFEMAREIKVPFTIHAGEAGDREWRQRSIDSAIRFGAKRIGHGIALCTSPKLMETCLDEGIGIECCPVSNVHTKAVRGGIGNHPISMFLKKGLLVSVNTDNQTVSNTNLEHEFEVIQAIGIGEAEQKVLTRNAIMMSFADDETKRWLVEEC